MSGSPRSAGTAWHAEPGAPDPQGEAAVALPDPPGERLDFAFPDHLRAALPAAGWLQLRIVVARRVVVAREGIGHCFRFAQGDRLCRIALRGGHAELGASHGQRFLLGPPRQNPPVPDAAKSERKNVLQEAANELDTRNRHIAPLALGPIS